MKIDLVYTNRILPFNQEKHFGMFVYLIEDTDDYKKGLYLGGIDSWERLTNDPIGLKTVPIPTASSTIFVYNASTQTYLPDNWNAIRDYCNISNNTKKNVGTYTVTVSLRNPAECEWVGGGTESKTFTFNIGKAAGFFSTSPYISGSNVVDGTFTGHYAVPEPGTGNGAVTLTWYKKPTPFGADATGGTVMSHDISVPLNYVGDYFMLKVDVAEGNNYLGFSGYVKSEQVIKKSVAFGFSKNNHTIELGAGSYTLPMKSTFSGVTFASSDSSIATVNSSGVVSLIKKGTVTFSASIADTEKIDYTPNTAQFTLNITAEDSVICGLFSSWNDEFAIDANKLRKVLASGNIPTNKLSQVVSGNKFHITRSQFISQYGSGKTAVWWFILPASNRVTGLSENGDPIDMNYIDNYTIFNSDVLDGGNNQKFSIEYDGYMYNVYASKLSVGKLSDNYDLEVTIQ